MIHMKGLKNKKLLHDFDKTVPTVEASHDLNMIAESSEKE